MPESTGPIIIPLLFQLPVMSFVHLNALVSLKGDNLRQYLKKSVYKYLKNKDGPKF
jgi:hypothetical protein